MDKRDYWCKIRTPRSWGLHPVHNWRRLTHRVVTEQAFDPKSVGQFLVVRDEGPHSYLRIQPYKEKFVEALKSMSRYAVHCRSGSPTIGIFHRSGDFRGLQPSNQDDEYLRRTHGYGYIPPEYASEALRKCRQIAGWDVPAVLSTDAEIEEVKCILSQGHVSLARTDSAFANLLEMRLHNVLILGTSSYGWWSYFLGDSFGIFPKIEGIDDGFKPLGIPARKGAWFVFEHQTSLNRRQVAADLLSALGKAP